MKIQSLTEPLAITMWDFSWLERRWPGAGYEGWDRVLDELVERGYNAVRIDAYPHLIAEDATAVWTIRPCWNQQDWGSPAKNRVVPQPQLNDFIRRCAVRGIHVGLSTWFQKTEEFDLGTLHSAASHAEVWKRTLISIAAAGLLDALLFVDFCNEWPLKVWAPFFKPEQSEDPRFAEPESLDWIEASIAPLREAYPDIAMTYSHTGLLGLGDQEAERIRQSLDFIEPHLWMVHGNENEFYQRVGYDYERFNPKGYENIAEHAERLYRSDPSYWKRLLENRIDEAVAESDRLALPMVTTECWSIVDYKDWPLLDWNWVKECCAHGVRHAAGKGKWLAMATSNFCGPQFVGMWRDKEWHQELTAVIKSARLPTFDESAGRWR